MLLGLSQDLKTAVIFANLKMRMFLHVWPGSGINTSIKSVKKLLAKELAVRPNRLLLLLFGREVGDEELLSLQRTELCCKRLPRKVEDYAGTDCKQDAVFKVVLAGAVGAGKTSILQRFLGADFSGIMPTIGVDVETKKLLIDDSLRVTLRLWDSQGRLPGRHNGESLGDLAPSLYAGASLVLLCVAADNVDSCQELYDMHTEVKQHSGAMIAIVVSKADLRCDTVVEAAQRFARDKSCFYFEVSARTGKGVDTMFHQLAGQLLDAHMIGPTSPRSPKR